MPAIEARKTTRASSPSAPASFKSGMASRAESHRPRTLTAKSWSKSSTAMESRVPIRSTPAEHTRPLRRPNRRPMSAKALVTLSTEATSHVCTCKRSAGAARSLRNAPSPASSRSSATTDHSPSHALRRQDDALARGLGVEQAIGLLGLVEAPAVREQLLDVDLAVRDEFGTVGLALLGEGPRPDQRHLPAQHVRADVEGHLAALADEAGRAPGAHRPHGRRPCIGRR